MYKECNTFASDDEPVKKERLFIMDFSSLLPNSVLENFTLQNFSKFLSPSHRIWIKQY